MIWNPCRWLARIFSCSGRCTGISLKFYGQSAILGWFVRKQNVFYGQTVIFRWFVRKFLAIMMRIYGQTGIFGSFVRNRHFWNSPFTDKVSIFIDVSVNGNDFDKCSAAHHLLNHCIWPRLRAKRCFLKFARNLRPHCFGEGNRVEHFSDFLRFCSTFEVARTDFGVGGRTFFQFWMILFYFRSRTPQIWRVR